MFIRTLSTIYVRTPGRETNPVQAEMEVDTDEETVDIKIEHAYIPYELLDLQIAGKRLELQIVVVENE